MRLGLAVLATLLFGASAAGAETAVVQAVEDGRTLRLEDGRGLLLDGLLPPDAADDDRGAGVDRAANAAVRALQTAAVGEPVAILNLLDAPDRWGRIAADARRIRDGVWLQALMLRQGHARIEACPRGDAERLAGLRAAERAARQANRGLWALDAYRVLDAGPRLRARAFAIVSGRPVATGGGRRVRYLNFDTNWRQDFTIRADRSAVRRLEKSGIDFEALPGRNLEARGWLFYSNGPMLEITCPQQIEASEP